MLQLIDWQPLHPVFSAVGPIATAASRKKKPLKAERHEVSSNAFQCPAMTYEDLVAPKGPPKTRAVALWSLYVPIAFLLIAPTISVAKYQ